jgi:hypothetical protein
MGSGEEVVQRRTEVVATRARWVGARGGEEGCLEWEEVRCELGSRFNFIGAGRGAPEGWSEEGNGQPLMVAIRARF